MNIITMENVFALQVQYMIFIILLNAEIVKLIPFAYLAILMIQAYVQAVKLNQLVNITRNVYVKRDLILI